MISQSEDSLFEQGKIQVVYLSISFLVLFTAYTSTQNIIGSLFKEQGFEQLGFLSLLVLYFAFAISTLFMNNVLKRFSYRSIFALSSIGYTLFTVCGIWVTLCQHNNQDGVCSLHLIYFATFLFSAICGVSASSIWVAQGVYIDQISTSIPSRKGALYGLFWAIFLVNNIISNLISALIINFMRPLDFFIITSSLGFLSTIFFAFMPQPKRTQSQNQNNQYEQPLSNQESLSKIFKLIVSKKTRSLMIFTCFSGVIMSFCTGFLSKLVEDTIIIDISSSVKVIQSQKLTLVFLCLGFFEVLSGVISHQLSDKISVYKLASISSLISLVAVMLSFIGLMSHSYFICFMVGATWGFSDGLFENLMSIIASKRFGGQVQIFQAIIFVQNMGFCVSQLLFTILEPYPIYVYPMIVNIFALLTTYTLQFDENTNSYQQIENKQDLEYFLLPEKDE